MSAPELEIPHQLGRGLLSTMRSLLVLGQLMTESTGERQILDLAMTAVPSLARCRVVGIEQAGGATRSTATVGLGRQLTQIGAMGGAVTLQDVTWAWAYPLGSPLRDYGFLVVAADAEPNSEEQFLLRALAQQTGSALANRQLHAQELATADELALVNERLRGTVEALQRSMEIHARLTSVAVSDEGRDGIARAVHELTGLPVAIEDRYGNLRAWAGPNRPDPYPKDPAPRREALLRRAQAAGRPIREGGTLVALAHPQGDVLGVICLVDPGGTAGEHEVMALEHGATILAMELARVRSLAESELRIRRDLVDELLTGTDEESALARATALGYDLQRPHRVVVVEGHGRSKDNDALFQAVRHAAREEPAGTLLVARGAQVILLADHEADWESLRQSVIRDLGGGTARITVGEQCSAVDDFPRSYRQARLAMHLLQTAEWDDRAVRFDDLGVYRLLIGNDSLDEVERFVERWIGPLLAYDTQRSADLVRTLTHYLDRGGNYEATAAALIVHRNTLKYRLQRIRQITGHDLSDPETCFNLQLATRAWQTLTALRTTPCPPGG
ncbi:CdaR family transcriptional regulator [Kineosporia sp. A_224]|uniref:PucR family transcriptional regulator n=1 Tax=Kineosporia sp. A_224 TaxID=1962180 RepID=UPI000B4B5735|nr:helix-turn-helix domain-containing protein [Kineosporia sp. A_224]